MKSILVSLITLFVGVANANVLNELKQLVDSEEPFLLFPYEDNGQHEFLGSSVDGCSFEFRDSVGLRGASGLFSYWNHTRYVDIPTLTGVELHNDMAPDYYSVSFETDVMGRIQVRNAEWILPDETRDLGTYQTFASFIRFKSEAKARRAFEIFEEVRTNCR